MGNTNLFTPAPCVVARAWSCCPSAENEKAIACHRFFQDGGAPAMCCAAPPTAKGWRLSRLAEASYMPTMRRDSGASSTFQGGLKDVSPVLSLVATGRGWYSSGFLPFCAPPSPSKDAFSSRNAGSFTTTYAAMSVRSTSPVPSRNAK